LAPSPAALFGALSEKWGRKRAIVTAALLAIPVIPLYAYGHSAVTLGIGAVLMQFMVQGAWGVVPAYLTELSPAPVRATAPGLAYQLGGLITSWNGKAQALAAERTGNYPAGAGDYRDRGGAGAGRAGAAGPRGQGEKRCSREKASTFFSRSMSRRGTGKIETSGSPCPCSLAIYSYVEDLIAGCGW
jgi:hypothetical protein